MSYLQIRNASTTKSSSGSNDREPVDHQPDNSADTDADSDDGYATVSAEVEPDDDSTMEFDRNELLPPVSNTEELSELDAALFDDSSVDDETVTSRPVGPPARRSRSSRLAAEQSLVGLVLAASAGALTVAILLALFLRHDGGDSHHQHSFLTDTTTEVVTNMNGESS